MSKTSNHTKRVGSALYKSEEEIARLVIGGRLNDWAALSAVWEREGLPKIDPMTGMRFWPAVERFLYVRHGISQGHVPTQVDGAETW